MGVGADKIGIINGQAVVDYASQRVYFTSYQRAAGNSTVWCLSLTTGLKIWSKDLGDVAGAPTLRGGKLYVPTNAGTIVALDDATNGTTLWTFSTGDGIAKGFVFLDRFSNQVYFSTDNFVWSVAFGAATETWKQPILSPSVPLFSAAKGRVWVGSSDGKLYALNSATGVPVAVETFTLGDGSATIGGPSLDVFGNFLYAGSEAGVIYAVELP
jgi:outer membrane protein assembly factor BamB